MQPKRSTRRRKTRVMPGIAPGTINIDPNAPKPVISVMAYSPTEYHEGSIEQIDQIREYWERWPVTWINVEGLGDEKTLRDLGEIYQLHRLALEDIVNVHQRAKVEIYDNHVFVVMRMFTDHSLVESAQLSLFLGERSVLTFQEQPNKCFEALKERIRLGNGKIRYNRTDYLAYAIIDTAIDQSFPTLEHLSDRLDQLEQQLLSAPSTAVLHNIHATKKDLSILRRAVWPKREVINRLARDELPYITDETRRYLQDCYDHTVQVIDIAENLRESVSGLTDLYMSTLSQKTNEIMKVLAIISTIFIPLSFIAGLYGMNFDSKNSTWNMPELSWTFGYPLVLVVMSLVAIAQLLFFRRKGWIGNIRR